MTRCAPIDRTLRTLSGHFAHPRFVSLNERGDPVEEASMERRTLQDHHLVDVVGGLVLLTVAALLVGVALLVAAS